MTSKADLGVLFGGPASYGEFAVTKRISKIDQYLSLAGCRVLDLGCGNGCYTVELARRASSICGVDIQYSHLSAFGEPIPRIQCSGEYLPFGDGVFDAITMIEVLEHMPSDKAVLVECWRVLKPGGRLVLFVPNKIYPFESHPCFIGRCPIGHNIPFVSWLPAGIRKHMCHAGIYTKRGLRALTAQAGFDTDHFSYIFPPVDHFSLPIKHQYRKLARFLERTPARIFGVSIFAVFSKRNTVVSD